MIKLIFSTFLIMQWSFFVPLFAQMYLSGDESLALGMNPPQAFQAYGAPARIFIQPGPAEQEADIVFYFSNHSYLYWFENRVWQVRFDRRHNDPVFGIHLGSTQDHVIRTLGQPMYNEPGEVVYPMTERGFPIRVRFLFEDNQLVEVFLYRSDF